MVASLRSILLSGAFAAVLCSSAVILLPVLASAAAAAPTNVAITCAPDGTSASMSWSPVAGATLYLPFSQDVTNNYSYLPPNTASSFTYKTSPYVFATTPGHVIRGYVYAYVNSEQSQPEFAPNVTCNPPAPPPPPPPPTPTPTPSPAPTASVTANGQHSLSVTPGTQYTIAWSSTNAASCSVTWNGTYNGTPSSGTQAWPTSGGGSTALIGSYTITCANSAGVTASDSVTITAASTTPPPPPPPSPPSVPTARLGIVDSIATEGAVADNGQIQFFTTGVGPLNINYTVSGGSYTSDYTLSTGNVGYMGIPSGGTYNNLFVYPRTDNATYEGNKTLTFTISPNAAYSIGSSSSVTVAVNDNESASPTTCTLDGVTLQNGQSGNFYSARTVSYPSNCPAIAQNRTCGSGTLSGTTTYQYASCTGPLTAAQIQNVVNLVTTFNINQASIDQVKTRLGSSIVPYTSTSTLALGAGPKVAGAFTQSLQSQLANVLAAMEEFVKSFLQRMGW